MTSGNEPATFRFVAQHLNHCATAVSWREQNTREKVKIDKIKKRRITKQSKAFSVLSMKIIIFYEYVE